MLQKKTARPLTALFGVIGIALSLFSLTVWMPKSADAGWDGAYPPECFASGVVDIYGSSDYVAHDAGDYHIIDYICIKADGFSTFPGGELGIDHSSGIYSDGSVPHNGCYTVKGIGTQKVIVKRNFDGKYCQPIVHIDVHTVKKVKPTATTTHTPIPPTPTRTHTPVPPTPTRTHTPVAPTATQTRTPIPPTATPTHTPVLPTQTATTVLLTPSATPTTQATNTPTPSTTPSKVPTATNTPSPLPSSPAPTPQPRPPQTGSGMLLGISPEAWIGGGLLALAASIVFSTAMFAVSRRR